MDPDISVSVTLHPNLVRKVIGGQTAEAVQRAAEITRQRIRTNIQSLGRIDTGEMLNSWEIRLDDSGGLHPRAVIYSTAEHTGYQERGTRPHGPVNAPRLAFTPKGSNTPVFATRVSGVPAGRFVEGAFERLSVSDFVR